METVDKVPTLQERLAQGVEWAGSTGRDNLASLFQALADELDRVDCTDELERLLAEIQGEVDILDRNRAWMEDRVRDLESDVSDLRSRVGELEEDAD